MKIFLDNRIVSRSKKELERLSPGLINRPGVFETMLFEDKAILFFDEHYRRMRRGLKKYGIKISLSKKDILLAVLELLHLNKLKKARVRVAVWKDKGIKTSIVALPVKKPKKKSWSGYLSKRRKRYSQFSGIKSMQYKAFRDALLEAKEKRFDEAILLNKKGEVVEGSRTNIFIVKGKKIMTPAVKCGCLRGITRGKIISLAKQLRYKVWEVSMKKEMLFCADEIFLTNSLVGIVPLSRIEVRGIGRKKIGPVSRKLLRQYSKELRKEKRG